MKKRACKILLILGIIFIVFYLIVLIGGLPLIYSILPNYGSGYIELIWQVALAIAFLFLIVGIILLIVAWAKWNSEKREAERQEVRKAQLHAIKRGKVHVELKGKMRKLK